MSRTPSPEEARRAVERAAEAAGDEAVRGSEDRPAQPVRRIVLTPASAIDPEPVVWAWQDESDSDVFGRIPAGSFGLFAGREGTGKSSFLIWLAARVTLGELGGAFKGDPRQVIYMAAEDSWKFTIVPRLMAAGADLDRVYRLEVQTIEDETVTLSLPLDNKILEQAITDNGVALVALDPLMSAISETLDTHVNRQVRQALDPLVRIADRTGVVVGGIAHFNKSASTDAAALITASGAFKDVARFIFAFAADPENDTQVITQVKNSLGRSNLPSLAYRIIEAVVPTLKGDARVGRLVVDGVADRSVTDILSAQQAPVADRDEKTRAEEFLRTALADGPRPSREVEDEARNAYQIAKRTLDRARQALNVATAKRGGAWCISLREHEGDLADYTPPAETVKAAKDANVGTVGNDAKAAKSSSPGEVGTVGNVDPADPGHGRHARPVTGEVRDLGYLAKRDPSLPDPRPPCGHIGCYEAGLARCLAGESVCGTCGQFLGALLASHTCTGEDHAA